MQTAKTGKGQLDEDGAETDILSSSTSDDHSSPANSNGEGESSTNAEGMWKEIWQHLAGKI